MDFAQIATGAMQAGPGGVFGDPYAFVAGIGMALLVLAGISITFKWAKATFFG